MFYSSFGILSLAVYLIINYEILIIGKNVDKSDATSFYRKFLFSVIFYLVTDIVWGITYEWRNIPLVYADTLFYFISMALSVAMWTLFVVEYLNARGRFGAILKYTGQAMLLVVVASIAFNLVYPLWFSFDAFGVYRPRRMRYAFLGTQMLLFLMTVLYTFYVFYKSSGKEKHHNLTIAISGTVMTVFIVLQTLYPLLPFYAVGCLLASALIHTFVSVDEDREKNHILENALEEAEKANTVKAVFLSNMSHELRTPINTILGMNEIIRNESSDKKILSSAENIRKAGTSLLGIISDILDFSKIEAEKMELINEDYYVPDMIGEIYNLVQFRVEEKGLKLSFDIDPGLPVKLVGDRLRLKQVIVNLIMNAVKYTEKGSVIFKIKLTSNDGANASLRFAVSDTGIGIREEDQAKLFQAFDRMDTMRNRTIEGAGLGLALASSFLQMMGTKLCVESTYDVGSDFYFDLCQVISDNTPIGTSWIEDSSDDKATAQGEILSFTSPESHMLIVDDTALNLEVLCGILEATKIQIDTAESGYECIEKFGSKDYDFVFLDYMMPQMDGIETLAQIKELYPEKADRTPIVSLTASAVSGERERMLAAGFTDYMTKPVITPRLMEMLVKYLPDEKIHIDGKAREMKHGSAYDGVHEGQQDAEVPSKLKALSWINIEEAIEFCGTADLYLRALELFANGIEEKAKILEECLAKEDIELFTITVHAMKSSLRTMGISDFSDRAKELELAGRNNDLGLINDKFPEFIKDLKGLKSTLLDAIGSENR